MGPWAHVYLGCHLVPDSGKVSQYLRSGNVVNTLRIIGIEVKSYYLSLTFCHGASSVVYDIGLEKRDNESIWYK